MPVTKKQSLLASATSAVPTTAKFDLNKDEVVKQTLSVRMIKVLPNSPTTSKLFEHTVVRLLRIEKQSRKALYACESELLDDPDLQAYFFNFMIASGRTNEGEQFLAYCQMPDAEQPNHYHTSGLRAMQIALEEPVARKPYEPTDSAYSIMRYGVGQDKPEIKKPDYSLDELFELAFDGREILNKKSAVIVALKALQVKAD